MSDRWIAALVISVMTAGLVIIEITGHGTPQILVLFGSPVVWGWLSTLLLKRQAVQGKVLATVAKQTDGLLSVQLASMKATGDDTAAQVQALVDVNPDLPDHSQRDGPVTVKTQ